MFTRVNYYVTNNHNKNLGKTQKMEKAFDEDNADEAVEFLRKFAKK